MNKTIILGQSMMAASLVVLLGMLTWSSYQTMWATRDAATVLRALDQKVTPPDGARTCEEPDGNGGTRTVTIGVPEACPPAADGKPALGQCIKGVPISEWQARCKAGKV